MLKISNLPKATKTKMVNWSKAWILTYDVLISDKTNNDTKINPMVATHLVLLHIFWRIAQFDYKKCHFSIIWVEVDMGFVDV
jgi:hypothetical protein